MKLSQLNPRWAICMAGHTTCMGIWFDCPGCGLHGVRATFPKFEPNGPEGIELTGHEPRFERDGDSFHNLTLTPRMDLGACGGWELTNGEFHCVIPVHQDIADYKARRVSIRNSPPSM